MPPQLPTPYRRPSLPAGLLLECVVTTINADGGVHMAPMGPIIDTAQTCALLRPYPPSATLANLARTGIGVMNVTDDIELVARAALKMLRREPDTSPTPCGRGRFLSNGCHWRLLKVVSIDDSPRPVLVDCQIEGGAHIREFFGYNRARHAIIEATILATRIDYLPREQVLNEISRLEALVEKTGGAAEHEAFDLVRRYAVGRTSSTIGEGQS